MESPYYTPKMFPIRNWNKPGNKILKPTVKPFTRHSTQTFTGRLYSKNKRNSNNTYTVNQLNYRPNTRNSFNSFRTSKLLV